MRSLALFLALAVTASAQQPGPQPASQAQTSPSEKGKQAQHPGPGSAPEPGPGTPPPGPPPRREHERDRDRDRGRDHDGERRGPPGMMGGKPRYDGFEKLSEDEKAKVRAAFEKAWQRPEVIAARDKAMRANEEMRSTLHGALKEIDPQVVAILEKIKPPFPMDQRGLPEMPKPDSPEFGRMAVARIGAEMLSVARPDRREETRRFHDRIMQMPRIKDELAKLEHLPPGEKMEGFKRFRDLYRQVATEEFMKLREKFEAFREGGGGPGGPGGFRRPPQPQPQGAPPQPPPAKPEQNVKN